jgi:hypothetical protein
MEVLKSKVNIILILIILNLFLTKESKSIDVKYNFSLIYSSLSEYRGALTWNHPFVFPGIGIVINNSFFIDGPRVRYVISPSKKFKISFSVNYFSDNGPLIWRNAYNLDHKNDRDYSLDSSIKFSYSFYRTRLSVNVKKELIEHYGVRVNAGIRVPLIPLLSAGYSQSWGDLESNKYAYGPTAISGQGHRKVYVNLFIPFMPFGGIMIANYSLSEIINETNRNGYYVKGQERPIRKLFILTSWNL